MRPLPCLASALLLLLVVPPGSASTGVQAEVPGVVQIEVCESLFDTNLPHGKEPMYFYTECMRAYFGKPGEPVMDAFVLVVCEVYDPLENQVVHGQGVLECAPCKDSDMGQEPCPDGERP